MPLRPDPGAGRDLSLSPGPPALVAARRAWLAGDLRCLLSPQPEAAHPGAAGDPDPRSGAPWLVDAATRLLQARRQAGYGRTGSTWTDAVDRAVVLRGLRVITAWFGDGPATLGTVTAGDGATTATWEVGPAPPPGCCASRSTRTADTSAPSRSAPRSASPARRPDGA